ncbi:MAG: hemolysin family protein [Cyclobacteriaceae bacterium]
MDPDSWLIIIVSLVLSAFFSGIEIAFISSDKLRIELSRQRGQIAGILLSPFVKRQSQFIGTMLIGNTAALVVYGIFMASILDPILAEKLIPPLNGDVPALLISTVIATMIVLITAEFIPKSIFMINPDWLLKVFAIPIAFFYYLLFPISYLLNALIKVVIVYVLRLRYEEYQPVFGMTDLNNFIQNIQKAENEDDSEVDTKIFSNALEFKTIKVRECMIPRTEIIAVDIEDGIDELKAAFIRSGHSKVIIYKETIDDIIGYCHSLEMFKKPTDVKSIMAPIMIVPETMLANELMIKFIGERKSLALVVDEFGGTSGIVSIEDIIEEIFGEIQDEHDDEDLIEEKIDEFNYVLSGRHEIDYLNDKYGWDLPLGDYDTLGGLILNINENIPEKDEIVKVTNYVFKVNSVIDARIDSVKLSIMDTGEIAV